MYISPGSFVTQPRIATNDYAVNHDLGVMRLGFFHKPGCCLTSDKSLAMLSYEKPLWLGLEIGTILGLQHLPTYMDQRR